MSVHLWKLSDRNALRLQGAFDPLESFFNIGDRVCVGKAKVSFTEFAEGRSGEARHSRLDEQLVGKLPGGLACPGDVGKYVKSAERFVTPDAGNRVQTRDDNVAAALEFLHHFFDVLLGPGERFDRRNL